jgi:pimeloyl-ACP methyl ester carboxylesterase
VFSFTHALEDAAAAVAFLRRDDMSARFDIDPERIFLAGHSLGAFVAANAAAHDPAIAGLVMISAWNLGEEGVRLRQPAFRKMAREREFSADDVDPLAGASADALIDETVAHAGQWDFLDYAASLKSKPVLMVSAGAGPGADSHRLAEKLRAMGDPSVAETWMPTDHAYSDHRIALETAVVAWLQRQTGARGPSR